MPNQAYVVVSAVRNEGLFLSETIASMRNQSIAPLRWVIVNDGSTDHTATLAGDAARQESWIECISRPDRGFRQSGVGVVEAFYDGFARVQHLPWMYVVKMDGDVRLPNDYFERLIEAFNTDARLGIASGDIYNETPEGLRLDSPNDPSFHVRGAAKMYRRACWDAIGGIPRCTGFDCVDNVHARMLNWNTRRINDLHVIHLRKTGDANGAWRNGFKDGIGANAIGYHPGFMVLKCLKRFVCGSPVGALGRLTGFISGYFKDIPRIENKELVRYLRRQQLNVLLRRESIWR